MLLLLWSTQSCQFGYSKARIPSTRPYLGTSQIKPISRTKETYGLVNSFPCQVHCSGTYSYSGPGVIFVGKLVELFPDCQFGVSFQRRAENSGPPHFVYLNQSELTGDGEEESPRTVCFPANDTSSLCLQTFVILLC